jgi:Ca2+-binding EF-hand superfamily protein
MPSFADYDSDGNGAITEQELNEARSRRINERAQQGYPMRNIPNAPAFTDIDTNGDGGISPEEFATHQSRSRQQGVNLP